MTTVFTVDELLTNTTPEAVKAQVFALLAASGVSVTAWQPLSPMRAVVDACSRLLAASQNLQTTVNRGGFRDTANANWLATTSRQTYGVDKILATYALGAITLTNAGGGVYDLDPGDLILKNTTTGKTYTNTAAIHIPATDVVLDAPIRATEIGADSNAAIGEVDDLVTTLLGVTCSNAAAVVGEDAETSDALRARDTDSLGALSPDGPKEAYNYVAKTPTLNGGVTVNRTKTLDPPGDGTLTVVVAGPGGALSGPEVALIQTGIDDNAEPATVTATVISATAVPLTITTDVYLAANSGFLSADVEVFVKQALLDFVNGSADVEDEDGNVITAGVVPLPIGGIDTGGGGKVSWRALVGAIERSGPDDNTRPISEATLGAEADVALGVSEVATLVDGAITVTVHFI